LHARGEFASACTARYYLEIELVPEQVGVQALAFVAKPEQLIE
jgi:hypothetical protein